MNPFCYVVEEANWDRTDFEVFPSYETMLEWLKKEVCGDRINQVALYKVLPDKNRTKITIDKRELIEKKSKSVVIQERIEEEQDEFFWK